jgi:hypothetical protein
MGEEDPHKNISFKSDRRYLSNGTHRLTPYVHSTFTLNFTPTLENGHRVEAEIEAEYELTIKYLKDEIEAVKKDISLIKLRETSGSMWSG